MTVKKIGIILISEMIEAFIFIVFLIVISTFPEVPGKENIILFLISGWALIGIATPFIIWFEIYDEIANIFKGGLKY